MKLSRLTFEHLTTTLCSLIRGQFVPLGLVYKRWLADDKNIDKPSLVLADLI